MPATRALPTTAACAEPESPASGNPQPERRERSGEDAGDVHGWTAPVASGAVRGGAGGGVGTTRRDTSSGTIGASAAASLKRPR